MLWGSILTSGETIKAKICLVGEAAVGKTSLIRRYVLDQFEDRYISTLGAKVSKKEIPFRVPEKNLDVNLVMIIWDIMGEKTFRDLAKEAFFHGSNGVLAVCDLTRYNTLREIDDWLESVFSVTDELPVVLAVNKVDLKEEVMLLYGDTELEQSARAFNAPYYYTSAKTGENVELVFEKLGSKIMERKMGL